jgi:hypothetical protein
MKKPKLRKELNAIKKLSAYVVILIVAVAGAHYLFNAHATSPYVAVAADKGVLTGSALEQQNCTGASDGNCVVFGSMTTSGCTNFEPKSIFCQQVTNASVDSNSSTLVASLLSQFSGSIYLNTNSVGYPIYRVSNQTAQTVEFGGLVGSNCSGDGSFGPFSIPMPSGANGNGDSDSSALFYDQSTNTGWELWEFTPPHENNTDSGVNNTANSNYIACAGSQFNTATTNGVTGGMAASSLSYLGTVISENDIADGTINHALAIYVKSCNGDVAPAVTSYGCNNSGSPIPFGQYFRFPTTVAIPSALSPIGQLVFHAVQNYGIVVTDLGSDVAIPAEEPTGYDLTTGTASGQDPLSKIVSESGNSPLSGIPWSSLQAIQEP